MQVAGVGREIGGWIGRGGEAEVAQVGRDEAVAGETCGKLRGPAGGVEGVAVDEEDGRAVAGFLVVEGEIARWELWAWLGDLFQKFVLFRARSVSAELRASEL